MSHSDDNEQQTYTVKEGESFCINTGGTQLTVEWVFVVINAKHTQI